MKEKLSQKDANRVKYDFADNKIDFFYLDRKFWTNK
jgi:hypothetical protein